MSWKRWAGVFALALSACGSDSESNRGELQASVVFLEASASYPKGHLEVTTSGLDVGFELEVWPVVVDENLAAGHRRARLANGRPAPPVLMVRSDSQAEPVFEPRFGLRPGGWYEAALSFQGKSEAHSMIFQVPPDMHVSSTTVTGIYPSADELPENLLRFYVYFSAPMRRGQAIEHVRLVKADGKEVEGVFLDIRPELWDAEARRLTLLLDPGRIKRGMPTLAVDGPNLREGCSYTLHIDPAWQDSTGAMLLAGGKKDFSVIGPDRTSPDALNWRLIPPSAGTQDPLRVELDEPLDRALLERMLNVEGESGSRLAGDPRVSEQELIWEWTPSIAWEPGSYVLAIDPVLEDRAGNGLVRLFDEVLVSDAPRLERPDLHMTFEVR